MNKKFYFFLSVVTLCFILLQPPKLFTQAPPEISILDNPSPGYLLFDWSFDPKFQLFDNYGKFIQKEDEIFNNLNTYPLKNGYFAQMNRNMFYIYDKNFVLIDSVISPSNLSMDFHDFVRLNNGRYLIICVEDLEVDMSRIIEGGRENAVVKNNILIETDRTGNIYWSWSAFQHLDIRDVTDDIDITQPVIDFAHINSLFETDDGNILISIRHFDEVSLINKLTGEFIWRLGGSECKNNQFTYTNDEVEGFHGFSHQHCAQILQNGNLLIFDNGNLKSRQYSRAVEYSLNTVNKTATRVWEHRAMPDLFSSGMSSAYRLPNGNTLIMFTEHKIVEVRPDNSIALEVIMVDKFSSYRAHKIIKNLEYLSLQIRNTGTFDFNDNYNRTGISINVQSLNGSGGMTHLQKHFYKPHYGQFEDTTFSSILDYRWVFTPDNNNFGNLSGKIVLDPLSISEIYEPEKVIIFKRNKEAEGVFVELHTVYDSVSNKIIAPFDGFGEFIICKSILDAPQPYAPMNGSITTTKGKLTWRKVQNAKNYRLQVATNAYFILPVINTETGNVDSYNYDGLNYNTIYYWRLQSISNKDTSAWSDIFSFKTNIIAPTLAHPNNNFIGLRLNENLSWNSAQSADIYQLQVSKGNTFDSLIIIDEKQLKETYYPIFLLDNNTEYYWRVRAFKGTDSSDWSGIRRFRTVIANSAPLFPANNSLNINDTTMFWWKKVSGAEQYLIELSLNADFEKGSMKTYTIADTFLLITDLQFDTKYYWRVKAARFTDSSDYSVTWSFTTRKEDKPPVEIATPEITYPADGSIAIPIFGQFEWNKVELATDYHLALTNKNTSSVHLYDQKDPSISKIDYINLHYNTEYLLKILAENEDAKSEWSVPIRFITELEPPVIIYPVNNAIDVPIEGKLVWDIADKQLFEVEIARDIHFEDVIAHELGIKELSINYSLFPNSYYYLRIKSYNDSNFSCWSEIVKFRTSPASSINSYQKNIDFTIFPNPAKSVIMIESEDDLDYLDVIICDINGKEQKRFVLEEVGRNIFNIGDLPCGIYFVKINNTSRLFIKN